jgi:transposase
LPYSHTFPFSLQTDAFTDYDRLFSAKRGGGALTEVTCWAHARRKIHDVYISSKSATTKEALKRISELYAIEDEIRGLPESERLAVRLQRKALLTSLRQYGASLTLTRMSSGRSYQTCSNLKKKCREVTGLPPYGTSH